MGEIRTKCGTLGQTEREIKLAKLIIVLSALGRNDDLVRAITSAAAREALYQELGMG